MTTRSWGTDRYSFTTRGLHFCIPLQELTAFTPLLIVRTLSQIQLWLKLF
jgi:hypothetical protein